MHSHNPSNKNPYVELGTALRTTRQEKGWSLRKAADAIKVVSYSRLRDFEHGEDPHSAIPTRPTEDQIRAIAKAYGCKSEPWLALAGYSTVAPMSSLEECLIQSFRRLEQCQQHQVLALVSKLVGTISD